MLAYWRIPKAKEKIEKTCAFRLFSCEDLGIHRRRVDFSSYAKFEDVLVVFEFH